LGTPAIDYYLWRFKKENVLLQRILEVADNISRNTHIAGGVITSIICCD
jgi:hypothetical protein